MNLVLHHRIAKAQTLTNWLRRPLTDQQLRYAVEDVAYLPAIYEHLLTRLKEEGRTAWAEEEFTALADPLLYERPIQQNLFKLKGSKKLDGLGLVVLKRLLEWRDRWAQNRNRPPRALMRDDVLVTIAKRRPHRASELEVLRGFPHSRKSRVVREVLDLVATAQNTPKNSWPQPHKPREETPMTKAALDILSAYTRAACHEEGLSHDLVGTTQRLRDLLGFLTGESKNRPLLLTGWREQFIGRRLVALLEGRSELHLSGWPRSLRLEVVTHPTKSRKPPGRTRSGPA